MRNGVRVFGTVLLGAVLALWLVPPSAWAQATGTGAFAHLSPGGQKIAQALYDAESPNKTMTLDDIAKLKQNGKGWGEVFKTMKKEKYLTQKNLGQVVKDFEHRDPEAAKLAKAELGKAERSEKPERLGRVERMERPGRLERHGR